MNQHPDRGPIKIADTTQLPDNCDQCKHSTNFTGQLLKCSVHKCSVNKNETCAEFDKEDD